MNDELRFLGVASIAAAAMLGAFIGGITALDYHLSSQATVDAINKECGTHYVRSDYLKIGPDTMRDLCRIKEQRIHLEGARP